jgi:hypothetical protein
MIIMQIDVKAPPFKNKLIFSQQKIFFNLGIFKIFINEIVNYVRRCGTVFWSVKMKKKSFSNNTI